MRFSAFSMTVKSQEAAHSATSMQLIITPADMPDIDSRFLLTKACAPGKRAMTWLMMYFSTSASPNRRLPMVRRNNKVGNRTSIEKYETAAADVVRSFSMKEVIARTMILLVGTLAVMYCLEAYRSRSIWL